MNFNELINLQLFKTDHVTITVYNVVIVILVLLATIIVLRILRGFFKRYIAKQEEQRRSY